MGQKKRKREQSDFERALDANEACGMPDGAAWALAEEQCGIEPGEGVYSLLEEDDER